MPHAENVICRSDRNSRCGQWIIDQRFFFFFVVQQFLGDEINFSQYLNNLIAMQ